MTTYVYDPAPKTNLLSFVLRGPDIEHVYRGISELGIACHDDLVAAYALRDKSGDPNTFMLDSALDFLRIIGVIGRNRDIRDGQEISRFANLAEADDLSLPFRLVLLRRLQLLGSGKNPFQAVHRYIVGQDFFQTDLGQLLVKLERPSDDEFSLNKEKLEFWTHLASYIGLTQRVNHKDGHLLCAPSIDLMVGLLSAYAARQHSQDLLMRSWLTFVEDEFCHCFTSGGSIHKGFATTILGLLECGKAQLEVRADDPESVTVGERRVSRIVLL